MFSLMIYLKFVLILLWTLNFVTNSNCQNRTTIPKPEFLRIFSWEIERYVPKTYGNYIERFKIAYDFINSKREFYNQGLKIDIYFDRVIRSVEEGPSVKPSFYDTTTKEPENTYEYFQGSKNQDDDYNTYKFNGRKLTIIGMNKYSIRLYGEIFDFKVTFDTIGFVPLEKSIIAFYVNGELLKGNIIEPKCNFKFPSFYNTQCSVYIKVSKVYSEKKSRIKFSYRPRNDVEGLNLIFVFRQDLKDVTARNFNTSKIDDNQWKLQNFGFYFEAYRTLSLEIDLEAEDKLDDPYIIAIAINEGILCWMPLGKPKEQMKIGNRTDFSNAQMHSDITSNILYVIIFLISILTLLTIGGQSYIAYLLRKKWQKSVYNLHNSQDTEQIKNDHFNEQIQHSPRFDDFVPNDYANSHI